MRKVPRRVFNQWAVRYRAFAVDRFERFSKGGGNWKKLSPVTIARRRQGGGDSGTVAILWDTGLLIGALGPRKRKGRLQMKLPNGVRVGYGGPGRYPKGGMTIAGVAEIHQTGAGRIPKRKIIVKPTRKVLRAMAGDVVRFWNSVSK